jgi:hypothetical protein
MKLSEKTARYLELESRIIARREATFERRCMLAASLMLVNACSYSFAAFQILMF